MPLSSRHDDPILEQIARDTFTLFPKCCRCGQPIERFEDADVRVHLQRVVHRGQCPAREGENVEWPEARQAGKPEGGEVGTSGGEGEQK